MDGVYRKKSQETISNPIEANGVQKQTKKSHKDTKYSWVICLATSGLFFLSFGTLRSSGVIFVALKTSFGTSRSENAMIFSTTFGSMFASCIITGIFVVKFGFRRLLIFGSILASSGPFFSYFVTDARYFVLTLGLLEGLGFGTILLMVLALNGHYFDRYLGTASGITMAGSSLGTLVMPPVIEYLIGEYGVRGACLVHSAILFHFILLSLLIHDPPKEAVTKKVLEYDNNSFEPSPEQLDKNQFPSGEIENNGQLSGKQGAAENDKQNEIFCSRLKRLLTNKYIYGIALMNVGVQTAVAGFSMSIPDFAVLGGATLLEASFLMSISSITDLLARLSVGFFIDKSGVNINLSYSSIALGSALTFFFIGLFGQRSYAVLAVLSAVFGFFYGGSIVHVPISTTRYIGKDDAPLAYSISFFFASILAFSIAPAMTAMFKAFDGYNEFFYCLGGLCLVIVAFWFITGVLEVSKERSATRAETSKEMV